MSISQDLLFFHLELGFISHWIKISTLEIRAKYLLFQMGGESEYTNF